MAGGATGTPRDSSKGVDMALFQTSMHVGVVAQLSTQETLVPASTDTRSGVDTFAVGPVCLGQMCTATNITPHSTLLDCALWGCVAEKVAPAALVDHRLVPHHNDCGTGTKHGLPSLGSTGRNGANRVNKCQTDCELILAHHVLNLPLPVGDIDELGWATDGVSLNFIQELPPIIHNALWVLHGHPMELNIDPFVPRV